MQFQLIRTVVLTIGIVIGGGYLPLAGAQSMDQYAATPPFITNAVPPNVLLLMDNSGSMNNLAYAAHAFSPTKAYYGLFDPFECYTYESETFKYDPAANPTTLGTCGTTYPWSGNLLNYVSMRRIDIVKWVMVGGTCTAGGRDQNGGCKTLVGQATFSTGACCKDQTIGVLVTAATGRMPSSLLSGSFQANTVWIHSMGSVGGLKGQFCVDNDDDQPNAQCDDDGGAYTETLWRIKVQLENDASGVVQEVGSKARFGLMQFKGSGDGGQVLNDVGGNLQNMITAIENTTPSTWTPLAESLYEATRYFAQIQPAYTNSDYSYTVSTRDPYWFKAPEWADSAQSVPCCKSFVIVFTDGQPTQDLNVPDSLKDFAHTAAAHGTSTHCGSAAGCTKNIEPFTGTGAQPKHGSITESDHNAMTDHHDNCSAYYGGRYNDSCQANGSHYLDDVAYFAHTTDLRQTTIPVLNVTGKPLDGDQKLTIYTFYAFGTGSNILKDTAKVGGFEDRNGNNLPDLAEEYDRVNNYTGAAGADGIPDTYFESEDADKLRERLLAAITSILQRSASGTSVSVLATSSTGEGSLYQAYFYPSTYEGFSEIKWMGYTQGLFIDAYGNMREDTNGDSRLVLTQDVIVKTRFDSLSGEVKVDRYRDDNGDGKADSTTAFETVSLKDLKPIWEAGKRLALTNAVDRKIYTWVDADNDGVVDTGEWIEFKDTGSNATTLSPYLRAGTTPYTAPNIINFIRGEQVAGLRDREVTVAGVSGKKVWKMGDPIHSTPTIIGAPKERYDVLYGDDSYATYFRQYKDRRQVAYVGANDGMLHAFNGGFYHRGDDPTTNGTTEHGWFTTDTKALGQELWGFIPYQLLPQLLWLTRADYTHVYYVDLKPKVTDVRIFADDQDHPGGWGTILIGGFRMGGSCGSCLAGTGAPPMAVTADFGTGTQTRQFYSAYFVLDITNPEKEPVLLWSFAESSLGLTTSYPAIVRVSPSDAAKTDNAAAKWLMVVGSGPTAYGGSSTQTGVFYAVDIKTGPKNADTGANQFFSFTTGDTNSFVGNVTSVDIQFDYRVDVAYGGTTYNNGGGPTWAGKLHRLTTTGCTGSNCVPSSTWGYNTGGGRGSTIVTAAFPSDGSIKVGPVVGAPSITMDEQNHLWLFFGTGRYFSLADKTNSDTQHFIGVKDPVPTGGCTETSPNNCEKRNLLNVSSASVCVVCATGTNQVTGVAGVETLEGSATTTLVGLIQTKDGWYTSLPNARERAMVTPVLLSGTVFFPTFIPNSEICTSSGTSLLYALFYLTGSAYKDSMIGTEAISGSTVAKRSISLGEGVGLASQIAIHLGGQGSGASGAPSSAGCQGRTTGFIQSSTGTLSQVCAKPALAAWSRTVSWSDQRE